jgi:hypothetical protein
MVKTNPGSSQHPRRYTHHLRQLRTFASSAAMHKYTVGLPSIGPSPGQLRGVNSTKIA